MLPPTANPLTGGALEELLAELLEATASFRRSESLLDEALSLADVTSGRTPTGRGADAARLLDAADRWHRGASDLPALVQELHAAILDLPVRRSAWRTGGSEVRRHETGELVHRGTPSGRIEHEIGELVERRAMATDPVETALETYAELQRIHPFDDGNGRVGRSVLHLDLARAMGTDLPPIGLLLAAQGVSHAEALAAHHRGQRDAWLAHVADCLRRAAASARS